MDYPSNAASCPRNDSLLRTTLALQHLAHVTTRCYGLANRSTHPRLTQRTVKTGISIYRPRCSYNAAFSPRNDSLLRTVLALQQLSHVTTRCYGLATTTRPYQRNVKTRTLIYKRPTDLSCPQRPSSCTQRLDHSQLTSIKHLAVSPRLDPATLVERPAANIYNSTIPANDITHIAEDHIQPPRTFTYTFVIPANKIVTFVVSVILPLCLPLLSLAVTTHTRVKTPKIIYGVDALIGSATMSAPVSIVNFPWLKQIREPMIERFTFP